MVGIVSVVVTVGVIMAGVYVIWRFRIARAEEVACLTRASGVIDSLETGLSVWNSEKLLVTCNESFQSFYPGIPLKIGMDFEDLVRFNARKSVVLIPTDKIDQWENDWIDRFGQYFSETLCTPDDRWIETKMIPLDNGETVLVYIDVTAHRLFADNSLVSSDIARKHAKAVSVLKRGMDIGRKAASFHAAAKQMLELVATCADLGAGTLYLVAANERRELVASGLWYLSEGEAAAALRLAIDEYGDDPEDEILRRALDTGKLGWVPNITVDPRLSENRRSAMVGVKGLCAAPIISGKRTVAVLEFFAFDQLILDSASEELITRMCDQLSHVFEREQYLSS